VGVGAEVDGSCPRSSTYCGIEFAGLPSLPVWMAGAVAALLLVAGVFSFSHSGRADRIGVAARVALILVGAVAGFLALEAWSRLDLRSERRDARCARAGAVRGATLPGSAFAVLILLWATSSIACEKAIFQTPEATAAALSYVATSSPCWPISPSMPEGWLEIPLALGKLRRSIEVIAWPGGARARGPRRLHAGQLSGFCAAHGSWAHRSQSVRAQLRALC